MKRSKSLCVIAALLCLALFAGCSAPAEQAAVTPTAASASGEQTAQPVALTTPASQAAAPSQPAEVTEPAKAEKQPEAEKAASSKTASSKATAKPAAEKAASSKAAAKPAAEKTASSKAPAKPATNSKPAASSQPAATTGTADLVRHIPTFSSEADFRQWLVKGDGSFETERQAAVAQMATGNTIRYYSFPALLNSQLLTLKQIDWEPNATDPAYCFRWADSTSTKSTINVTAFVFEPEYGKKMLEKDQQNIDDGEEGWGKKTVNGIEYYYYQNPNGYACVIDWKQDGCYACVLMHDYTDRMDQLLPLLTIEPVTLRTDVVTE